MNTFCVKIEAPKNVNTTYLNPHEIQTAFNHFFLQNPQVLIRIFETLGKNRVKQQPILQSEIKGKLFQRI